MLLFLSIYSIVQVIIFNNLKTSLALVKLDTSKTNLINDSYLNRQQERVFSTIDVINLGHILTQPNSYEIFNNCVDWELKELFDDDAQ